MVEEAKIVKKVIKSQQKPAGSSQGSGGQDYVDKGKSLSKETLSMWPRAKSRFVIRTNLDVAAWDSVSKKAGHDFDRSTDEKITDGARSAFEKATG